MANQLQHAYSPYLQEHAGNPVDWYPWGDEALALAKTLDKPILLSIGYSACHWCHVMAYESFEDPDTAALMNELFINIKVDREERPDLDKIYQLAHQLITQRPGGWPLTVFLTPGDCVPYFAGTYFPKSEEAGTVTFTQVLKHVSQCYHDKRGEINELSEELKTALKQLSQTTFKPDTLLTDEPIKLALKQLSEDFDPVYGGFGQAPKFPHPVQLNFLMPHDRAMVEKTLDCMAYGGIYDQLGGGFFRYAVDPAWEVPHFEKMLYDSALLLPVYANAYKAYERETYKRILLETGLWLIEHMQAPQGGFYTTLNADSEGVEGKYYLWSKEDIQLHLNDIEQKQLKHYFNLGKQANVEGCWHLHLSDHNTPRTKEITLACQNLLAVRLQRIPPSRDEKILCGWNALTIKGLYAAGLALNHADFIDAADKALDYLLNHFYQDGKLYAAAKDEQVYLDAYLDDYAFLIDALLQRLQVNWSKRHLDIACQLTDSVIAHFFDEESRNFYFTTDNHETLVQRPKSFLDDATPSGNNILCHSLQGLGYITGNNDYLDLAKQVLQSTWEYLSNFPAAHSSLLPALQEYLNPPTVIYICGEEHDTWQHCFNQHYLPHTLCFSVANEERPAHIKETKKTAAYICVGKTCKQPIDTLAEFEKMLRSETHRI